MARSKHLGLSPDMPDLREIDIASIRPSPNQPRTSADAGLTEMSIRELADSIDAAGMLINPVTVIPGEETDTYILATGQRRVRAFELLGRETIPAIVAKSGKLREISLIENLQRRDLHPLDTAEAIAGMKSEFGWTDEQIAKEISTSRVTVTEWLALTTLPESIRTECRALDIPKTSLVAIARVTDPEEQAKLWEEIKAGKVVTT